MNNVKQITTLVIGGAGYIGSIVCEKLLADGRNVVALDMLLYGESGLAKLKKDDNFRLVRADFRDITTLYTLMCDVDEVVHLAGLVGDPACAFDQNVTLDINLIATKLVLDVAKLSGVKTLVFASSCSVYGSSDLVSDENSELNPVSLYAETKIASENLCLAYKSETLDIKILRFATIYGVSDRMRYDLVANVLTLNAIETSQFSVFNGHQWRPFLHVADAAKSVCVALNGPKNIDNPIFNVGSDDQNHTISEVGEMVVKKVPNAILNHVENDQDPRNYHVDFSKIQDVFGFTCDWNLEMGIETLVEEVKERRTDHSLLDDTTSNYLFLKNGGVEKLINLQSGWLKPCIPYLK
ncbi:MAG: NAD(P)-dependent oxidoreductase [Alphaproteobacteria bacterium]